MPKPRRPNKKTVARVIKWLNEELGVELSGQCIDLEDGEMYQSMMNYDAEDVEKLYKLQQRGLLWEREE